MAFKIRDAGLHRFVINTIAWWPHTQINLAIMWPQINMRQRRLFHCVCLMITVKKVLNWNSSKIFFFTFVKEENMISTSVRFYCSLCPFWENFDSLFRWSPGQDTIGRTIIKYMHINGFLYMLQLFKNIFLFYLFMDFIFFRKIYHL